MPKFDNIILTGGFTFSLPVQDFFVLKDWSDMGSPFQFSTVYKPIYDSANTTYYSPSVTGIMYTSNTNAASWTMQNKGVISSNLRVTMNSIAYNGSNRFAASVSGTLSGTTVNGIIYSNNAVDWTVVAGSTGQRGILWTGNRFVCKSNTNTILNSADGIIWGTSGGPTTPNTFNMPATNGNGIVVFPHGTLQDYLISNNGGGSFSSVSYPFHVPGTFLQGQMCFAQGAFFQSRGTSVLYSPDGSNWSNAGNIFPSGSENNFNSAATNGTIVVATQSNGKVLTTLASSFPNIPANVKWTSVDTGTNRDLYGIMHDGSKFVVNGENGIILTSTDGTNWTIAKQAQLTTANIMPATFIAGIGNEDTAIMTVQATTGPYQFYTSNDGGNNWAVSDVSGNRSINAFVTDGSNYYGAASQGKLYTSSDSTTWNVSNITSNTSISLLDITYGSSANNKFVSIGWDVSNNTFTYFSQDSTSWAQGNSIPGYAPLSVVYDGTQYVYLGRSFGVFGIATSANGNIWSAITTVFSGTSGAVADLAYNNSLYVVVGSSNFSTGNGSVYTSTDLTNWTYRDSKVTGSLYSVSFNSNLSQFIAVGEGGSIAASNDGIDWTNRSSTETISTLHEISNDYIFSDTNIIKLLVI